MRAHLGLALLFAGAAAIDNGLGVVPPRGWRSWNQFQCSINQTLVEAQYRAMVEERSLDGGERISLLSLGYRTAGIDDCWQKCDSGPGGQGFHGADGYPIVDKSLFPDMRAMAARAKELGLIPGWYGNNCHCKEERAGCALQPDGGDSCFAGDVKATLDFGFESIKLDGCGIERNVTHYAHLFNKTGHRVLIENCHNGAPTYPARGPTGEVDCPMNLFRSSTDIRPTFGSVLINLNSTRAYNGAGLTGPGCWACVRRALLPGSPSRRGGRSAAGTSRQVSGHARGRRDQLAARARVQGVGAVRLHPLARRGAHALRGVVHRLGAPGARERPHRHGDGGGGLADHLKP
jgi:hypothetical protein